jgi:ElaA protein
MIPINWQTAALRDLTPQTLYRLLALRSAVFVVEQTCCYLDPDGADLTALHVWAEQDGEIMACCRILPPENSTAPAAIGRVVINPQCRRSGGIPVFRYTANYYQCPGASDRVL